MRRLKQLCRKQLLFYLISRMHTHIKFSIGFSLYNASETRRGRIDDYAKSSDTENYIIGNEKEIQKFHTMVLSCGSYIFDKTQIGDTFII